MKKYYVGYITSNYLHTMRDDQAKKLTHLNLAFAPMVGDITVMVLEDKDIRELTRIKKANPELQILVSTGGGGNRGHGEATKTKAGMDKLVTSTMDIIHRYDLDGIDCDWEFPGDDGTVEEKYQHTALLAAYREELDKLGAQKNKKYWLTTAAGAGQWFIDRTEIHKSHVYLDFINLMTYDSGICDYTSHHTHLYEPAGGCTRPQSAHYNIELLLNVGVPIEKMLIGMAFYSHQWDDVPDVNHGFFQKTEGGCLFGPNYTQLMEIYKNDKSLVRYFDESAKAPYLYNGGTFYTYDDEESIAYKVQYAKDRNMLGAFYWVHQSDRDGILFDAIYNNLYK